MTLTTEQIREILEGAPDNSAIYDGTGLYFDQYGNHLNSDGLWSNSDAQPMSGRNLCDLREILTLRQRVEELEAQQSEVAARAYEKGVCDACECVNKEMSLDEIEECAEGAGKSYANQLRKGEGDDS